MKVRKYDVLDGNAAVAAFLNAVQGLGRAAYSEAQVRAWATFADDAERFQHRLTDGYTVVAELDESVVAFGQLHPQDHIEMLYCRSDYGGRGIGTALLGELERVARLRGAKSLSTDASRVAQAFFLKRGYRTTKMELVACFGVELPRYYMQKILAPNSNPRIRRWPKASADD